LYKSIILHQTITGRDRITFTNRLCGSRCFHLRQCEQYDLWLGVGHSGSVYLDMAIAWKIIATTERPGRGVHLREYFIVREADRNAAIAALRRNCPDLFDANCEVRGEASQDFLDWLDEDQDIFCIMSLT
jgi:hypothetical protein